MTPEEAFEAWWQSLPKIENAITSFRLVDNSVVSPYQAKAAWQACSAHYEREVKPHGKAWVDSVSKELADYDATVVRVSEIEAVCKEWEQSPNSVYRSMAPVLRTRLLTKGGE